MQNIAGLFERGVCGYRRHAARARCRIASLAHCHVSSELFIRCFELLHSCLVRIINLIEIKYLYDDDITCQYILAHAHTHRKGKGRIIFITPASFTSLLNLSCSDRTVTSYRFSIFLISCSSLNLSFVNFVFSTSI